MTDPSFNPIAIALLFWPARLLHSCWTAPRSAAPEVALHWVGPLHFHAGSTSNVPDGSVGIHEENFLRPLSVPAFSSSADWVCTSSFVPFLNHAVHE